MSAYDDNREHAEHWDRQLELAEAEENFERNWEAERRERGEPNQYGERP